jgi:hypothetical protein
MHAYDIADRIAFTSCFILAVLTMIAYARWHFWWRSGFGRARMAIIVAFAGLTAEHAARGWITLQLNSIPDHVLDIIRLASAALASAALLYLLYGIISINIRRVRDPGFAASQARRHLELTPWATDEDIAKLLAAWDEMHGNPRL